MGFLGRLLGRADPSPSVATAQTDSRPDWMVDGVEAQLCEGHVNLDVVGESFYQDNLWRIVGGRTPENVRQAVLALLVADETNPYDPNSISAWINGLKVGHLSRDLAEAYRDGLLALQASAGKPVALAGVIAGAGPRGAGVGMLGVFLQHEPADFGVATSGSSPAVRTGRATADGDDGMTWMGKLPDDELKAIVALRGLLADTAAPIDRHYMYSELEHRLYRSRDAFGSALDEYDAACTSHDDEMRSIRPELLARFGSIPLLETYRQMAIRQTKAKNWAEAARWAERGIEVYGDKASDPEWVDDLQRRADRCRAQQVDRGHLARPQTTPAEQSPSPPRATSTELETLTCASCGEEFSRARTRGRKPTHCPECRLRWQK